MSSTLRDQRIAAVRDVMGWDVQPENEYENATAALAADIVDAVMAVPDQQVSVDGGTLPDMDSDRSHLPNADEPGPDGGDVVREPGVYTPNTDGTDQPAVKDPNTPGRGEDPDLPASAQQSDNP